MAKLGGSVWPQRRKEEKRRQRSTDSISKALVFLFREQESSSPSSVHTAAPRVGCRHSVGPPRSRWMSQEGAPQSLEHVFNIRHESITVSGRQGQSGMTEDDSFRQTTHPYHHCLKRHIRARRKSTAYDWFHKHTHFCLGFQWHSLASHFSICKHLQLTGNILD